MANFEDMKKRPAHIYSYFKYEFNIAADNEEYYLSLPVAKIWRKRDLRNTGRRKVERKEKTNNR